MIGCDCIAANVREPLAYLQVVIRRSTCPWIINSITFMQGVLLKRIFIIEHGVWRQIRSIVYWTWVWDTLLMAFTIVNTIQAGPRYPLLAPTTPCLLKGSLSEVSPPPCCFSRLPQKICDMLRFVITLIFYRTQSDHCLLSLVPLPCFYYWGLMMEPWQLLDGAY